MASQKGTSPAERPNGEMAEKEVAWNQLLQLMHTRASLEADADTGGRQDSVAAIMLSDENTIWDADDRESIGGRDLANVEMRIESILIRRGRGRGPEGNIFRDPDGNGLYVEVGAVRLSREGKLKGVEPGEEFVWNTSAPRVVAKLIRLEQLDMLPADVYMQEIDLGDGTATIKLKPLGRRSVIATEAI